MFGATVQTICDIANLKCPARVRWADKNEQLAENYNRLEAAITRRHELLDRLEASINHSMLLHWRTLVELSRINIIDCFINCIIACNNGASQIICVALLSFVLLLFAFHSTVSVSLFRDKRSTGRKSRMFLYLSCIWRRHCRRLR